MTTVDVEVLHRAHQRQACCLLQVLQLATSAAIVAGDPARKRKVEGHDLVEGLGAYVAGGLAGRSVEELLGLPSAFAEAGPAGTVMSSPSTST